MTEQLTERHLTRWQRAILFLLGQYWMVEELERMQRLRRDLQEFLDREEGNDSASS